MLIFAAALLAASLHSSGAVEAPGVPAAVVVSTAADQPGAAPVRHTPPVPTPAVADHAPVEPLAHATGRSWLEALGSAGPGTLQTLSLIHI